MGIEVDKFKTDKHEGYARLLLNKDPHSLGVLHALEQVYPAFAEKLFQGSKFMKAYVTSLYNPMDILDYPICGRCETVSVYCDSALGRDMLYHDTCKCFACGSTTVDPILVRTWLAYELKKRVPQEYIDAIDTVVDDVAKTYLLRQKKQYDMMQVRMSNATAYADESRVYDKEAK